MRAPMTGVDGVFHVAAGKIGVADRGGARAINVDGTRHVLELMAELGVPPASTPAPAVNSDTHGQVVDETYRFNGRHVSLYDETKAEAHHIAESFIARGLPLVIVQPGLVYGPGDTSGVRTTFIEFLTGKLPAIPKGAAYSWAHVDDIARGLVLAIERGRPGRNYFLAGPPHTLASAIDLASEITGVPAPKIRIPGGAARRVGDHVRRRRSRPRAAGLYSRGLRGSRA
jgi:nucleoside-diphosphate-sugar epimerase